MEVLREIWTIIGPSVISFITNGSFIGLIFVLLKSKFNKAIKNVDRKKIVEEVAEIVIAEEKKYIDEKLKTITYKQSIEPLCKSEFIKLQEINDEKYKQLHDEMLNKFDKILTVNEKFALYFDDSLVPDQKKKALHEAIEEAKVVEVPTEAEFKVVEDSKDVEIKDEPKVEKEEKSKSKNVIR